ncbi:MAG: hypothetical protein KIT25_00065 [Enhydrobacter sp.]|nr:MAG: hypothetical protein KIT25_00065 [Enhydrobacter sp.]
MSNEGLFTKGGPGGPGRPKGSRNKEMHYARRLHSEHGREALQRVVDNMRDTDKRVSQRASEFVLMQGPRVAEEPIQVELPEVNSLADAKRALNALNQAMGAGEITPEKADVAMRVIERQWRMLVATELEREVEELREVADEFLKLKRAVEEAGKS